MLQTLLVQLDGSVHANNDGAVLSLGDFVEMNDIDGVAALKIAGGLLALGYADLDIGNGCTAIVRRFGG